MLQNKQAKERREEKKEEKRRKRGKGRQAELADQKGGGHQVTAEGIASSPMRARPRATAFRPRLRAAESASLPEIRRKVCRL